MKLEDIKGIGAATAAKIEELGVTSVEEIAQANAELIAQIMEVVDKPESTLNNWVEGAKELVGDDSDSGDTIDATESESGSESTPAAVEEVEEASTDVETWLSEVAGPKIENGHSRRSILFLAGLQFNEDDPRALTRHIKQGISIQDNVRLAISKL